MGWGLKSLAVVLVLAAFTLAFLPSAVLATQTIFNVTSYNTTLPGSTQNQIFNITIGANHSLPGANITAVIITIYSFDGFTHIVGSNFTNSSSIFSGPTGPLNFSNVLFTNTTVFPLTNLTWTNTSTAGIIPNGLNRTFSIRVSTPLRTEPTAILISVNYTSGHAESDFLPIRLTSPTVTGFVNISRPINNTVVTNNEFNITFSVNGTANFYACLAFKNETTPFGGDMFMPVFAPPNFNVTNATINNISVFFPSGIFQWNVKCVPKDEYLANRTTAGWNVTRNGLPASLNSVKVGDVVNFTNGLTAPISITFSPPFAPQVVVQLNESGDVNNSFKVDTSPDFTNALGGRPPLMGFFTDNGSLDQFNNGVIGGFGQSGDPRFAPGIFAAANYTLNVSGFSKMFFDPGDVFNGMQGGFSFDGGPCSPATPGPKPPFCFPNASGGVSFDAKDGAFFDKHPDFAMTGFTDCTDPTKVNTPDCKIMFDPTAEITGDTSTPNVLFTKVGGFADTTFLDFGTDEMTNMTLNYYGIDSYCSNKIITVTDEGVRDPNGNLLTNSRFKPFHHFEIGSRTASNISISSNSTYYYKTNVCDKAGNCVSSTSCKSFNSSTTSFANAQVAMNFTIPSGFNFNFRFPNGTNMAIGSTQTLNNLTQFLNVTMKFQPTGANWGIDLPASALTTNSSFDFTLAFKTVTSGGRTFVGMNKTVWESLAQRIGVSAINITIVGTGNTLYKCSDTGANCQQVSSVATKVATDTSAGTSTWTVPTTLGFSTYVDNPTAVSTSASSSSSGGGGGGGSTIASSAGKVTRKYSSIGPTTPRVIRELEINAAGTAVKEINISVKSLVISPEITIEKLSGKPAEITKNLSNAVYQYINLTKANLPDDVLDKADIDFTVTKEWMTNNSVSVDNIRLYRFADNLWNELTTTKLSETNTSASYRASTFGFSTFAISAASVKTTTTESNQTTPTQQPAQQEQPKTTAGEQKPSAPALPMEYIAGIIAVIIVAVAGFMFYRSRK